MDKTAYLQEIDRVIQTGKYRDTWESLSQYRIPEWYKDTKLGIFIHWGVYSVPAFGNEWYPRNMYIQCSPEFEHHVKTYGPQKDFGYKDFIPMFKAEKFDAEAWADLFQQAGAKYVVPVAEHHDGFQMYKSELSHWNAAEMGPTRDILGELETAFEKRGIITGASSHRIEHWFFMGHGRDFDSDVKEPMECGDFYWPATKEPESHQDLYSTPTPSQEFLEDWLLRCCEIVDRYRPRIVYFDWWIQHSAVRPYLRRFAAYYYNRALEWGEEVAINYKHDAFDFGCAVVDIERGQFADIQPFFWQTDTAIAKNSWCYTENNDFKKAKDILCDLVDIVSKNGTLLLNVGPKADGSFSEEDRQVLTEIGQWMQINGEAIYGSRPWRVAAEGPTKIQGGQFTDAVDKVFTKEDIRYTMHNGYLYAAVLNYAEGGSVNLTSLAEQDASRLPLFHGIVKDVRVLGFDEIPQWKRDGNGLHIHTDTVRSDKPVVFKITLE